MPLTRRRLLRSLGAAAGIAGVGAGGVALVDAEVLPGRSVLNRTLGRCDARPPDAPRAPAPPPVTGNFRSAARRRRVGFAIAYPPGYAPGARLPVCLALHGYAADAGTAVGAAGCPEFLAGALPHGAAPFALAALTHPDRFRAVVATSPAIFHSYADARRVNAGAFDSADEWARYDVTARAGEFAGLPVRIAIGAADPFTEAVRTLRDRLPGPSAVEITTGCHDGHYWWSVAPGQVRAISAALAD